MKHDLKFYQDTVDMIKRCLQYLRNRKWFGSALSPLTPTITYVHIRSSGFGYYEHRGHNIVVNTAKIVDHASHLESIASIMASFACEMHYVMADEIYRNARYARTSIRPVRFPYGSARWKYYYVHMQTALK